MPDSSERPATSDATDSVPTPGTPATAAEAPRGQTVKAGQSPRALTIFAMVTLAVLAADLALKYVAFRTVAGQPVQLDPDLPGRAMIPPHQPVEAVPYLLNLQLTANEGAVFGLGQGGRWVFIAISVVAVAVILHFLWHSAANARVFHLGLALILGGAMGNLYDRVFYSAVRDMLWLFPGVPLPFGLNWPGGAVGLWPWIFNLADAALMVGVALVIGVIWVNEMRQRNARAAGG